MNAAPTTGVHKAAVLLLLLGEEASSAICRNLDAEDLRRVAGEIAKMDQVAPAVALQTLQEYQTLASDNQGKIQGGMQYVKKLLAKTVGPENTERWLEDIRKALETRAARLDGLQNADPQQLARFLEREHPQTVALTLAHLDAKQGAALLLRLPENVRGEAVRRLAELRQFSPQMAQQVALVLHERLKAIGEHSRQTYTGLNGVAELLNRVDAASTKAILEMIEKDDAELALNIRNRMFTFEDLLGVPQAGIRELLGQLDKKTLATALRGASEEVKSFIFKAMSSRAVEMLKEDMEVLGPVRSRDIQKAQQEAVAVARKLEAEGKLVLRQESQDEYIT